MGLSKKEAKDWADKWIEQMNDERFTLFKLAFKFASGYDGLSLSKAAALTWAESAFLKLTEKQFAEFLEAFKFASNYNGLSLSKPEAYDWTLEKLNLLKREFPADF